MSALRLALLRCLFIAHLARANSSSHVPDFPAILGVTPLQWISLNESVGGRLHINYPMGLSCYDSYSKCSLTQFDAEKHSPDLARCHKLQQNKTASTYLANQPNGYLYGDIGFCQAKDQGCPLKYSSPDSPLPISGVCHQGAVSNYYIDARNLSDLQNGLAFASIYHIPLVIKSTGHDHKGRSAGPNSLALWYSSQHMKQ